ncbi:MAG: ABC transporter substrate-binding protein, partial [Caldimonas sp.]
MNSRTRRLAAIVISAMLAGSVHAAAETRPWADIAAAAKGQTVYWNAWAGDERTNAFIAWVGGEVKKRHGVTVVQVKLNDTAEA